MSDVIDWPIDLIPADMTWALEANNVAYESPFTKDVQVVTLPGSRWVTTLTFNDVVGAKRQLLETIVMGLNGMAGRVRLWDFGARLVGSPQPVLGAPVVSAAGQVGVFLATRGWLPDSLVLRLGDWVSVNGELKRIRANVVSDGAGQAILPILPMLRSPPPTGTPIDVSRPCGVFRLSSDDQGKFSRKPGMYVQSSVNIEFKETWST
jgi:hypothetical protein